MTASPTASNGTGQASFTVTNVGTATAAATQLQVVVAGTLPVTNGGGGTVKGRTVTVTTPALSPGQVVTTTITVGTTGSRGVDVLVGRLLKPGADTNRANDTASTAAYRR